MAAINHARAEELICQLQEVHQREIQILRELHGIRETQDPQDGPGDDAAQRPGIEDSDSSSGNDDLPQRGSGSGLQSSGDVYMPPEWSAPWSDELLIQQVKMREKNARYLYRANSPDGISNIESRDPAAMFICHNALRSLRNFTFGSPMEVQDFMIINSDRNRRVTWQTGIDRDSDYRQLLFSGRDAASSYHRMILVWKFTPSAIATVLLSDTSSGCGPESLYEAMRGHVSRRVDDRFRDFQVKKFSGDDKLLSVSDTITVTYFNLTAEMPATYEAPLAVAGLFGVQGPNRKYIWEQRFTLWQSRSDRGPSSLAVFGGERWEDPRPIGSWLGAQLWNIWFNWDEVLNYLDEQTRLPSTLIFDDQLRQSLLFDDDNFTNAKRYFWALQSLRIFDDYIDGTLRLLRKARRLFEPADDVEMHIQKFGELKARIERKRQEVESLNNGLFSASSVAESRFSSEQNGNIRLLTLVTIAYLPLSFAATLYGMNVLPESTTLGSFFVVTAMLSMITFAIVSNLQWITVFLRKQLDKASSRMLNDQSSGWRDRGQQLRQEGQNKRMAYPASKWLYLGYLFHAIFGRRKATLPHD